MLTKNLIYASIYGGVVGDALGVPYEFCSKTDMEQYPATTMRGYGTYSQPVGTWSDDSSLTLATLDSLTNGLNYEDMMTKFCEWRYCSKYTPHGDVFDVETTTRVALSYFHDDNKEALNCGLLDEGSNGNGSLMRIMPAVLYANANKFSIDEQIKFIDNISSLTHAHSISKASCNIYNFIAQEVINHQDNDFQQLIEDGINKSRRYYDNNNYECFNTIYNSLFSLSDDYIFSRGYVVSSLEVALYCCYHTSSYKQAILRAVNLGGDTDTNAMVTGALAGLYYGYDNIPAEWLRKIARFNYIKELCDKFYEHIILQK